MKRIIAATVTSLFTAFVSASDVNFINDKARGWFFYEDPVYVPVEEEQRPECLSNPEGQIFWDVSGLTHTAIKVVNGSVISKDQFGNFAQLPFDSVRCSPPKMTPAPPKDTSTPPTTTADAGPPPLSAEWLEVNLPKYRKEAIDNPQDPTKMRMYLYLQRITMDKSEQFARTAQSVTVGDPVLDEMNRYGIGAQYAYQRADANARQWTKSTIEENVSPVTGIAFFFDEACYVCGQQAFVLNQLKNRYDLSLNVISMDGSPLKNDQLAPLSKQDTGQAAFMGITKFPAIALLYPEKNAFRVISQGAPLTDFELERRLLLAAKELDVISPEQYDKTRIIDGQGLFNIDYDQLTPEVVNDPELFLKKIRTMRQ